MFIGWLVVAAARQYVIGTKATYPLFCSCGVNRSHASDAILHWERTCVTKSQVWCFEMMWMQWLLHLTIAPQYQHPSHQHREGVEEVEPKDQAGINTASH